MEGQNWTKNTNLFGKFCLRKNKKLLKIFKSLFFSIFFNYEQNSSKIEPYLLMNYGSNAIQNLIKI